MFCTECGIQLRDDDRFCSRCGRRTAAGEEPHPSRTLMLDKRNKKVAGVCAGFARYFDADVTLVRVLWLAIALGTGVGFIAYLVAWILMPSDNGRTAPAASPMFPAQGELSSSR
jgi:phage shock protein C